MHCGIQKLTLTSAHLVWYTTLRTSLTGLGTVTGDPCVVELCEGAVVVVVVVVVVVTSSVDAERGETGERSSPSKMLKAAFPVKTKSE